MISDLGQPPRWPTTMSLPLISTPQGWLLQVIHPPSISTPGQGATPPPPAFLSISTACGI